MRVTFSITRNAPKGDARLEDRLKETKKRRRTENRRRGAVVQDVYFVSTAKSIIEEIDRLLARHDGFAQEELEFLSNCDTKYPMRKEAEGNAE